MPEYTVAYVEAVPQGQAIKTMKVDAQNVVIKDGVLSLFKGGETTVLIAAFPAGAWVYVNKTGKS